MPGLDGLQLVEKARHLHPDLDVLLISGYTDHRVPPSKHKRSS
jgi:YesN/AraC family two-component response regulator